MITITLDTPVVHDGRTVTELTFETPIRAGHLLKAMRSSANSAGMTQVFTESVLGVEPGFLDLLTLEDFAKVQSVILPFLASFQRLQGEGIP